MNIFHKGASVLIAAGTGNNGADGIALARQLHGDYEVKLYVPFELHSAMAKVQFERAAFLGLRTVDTIKSGRCSGRCTFWSRTQIEI